MKFILSSETHKCPNINNKNHVLLGHFLNLTTPICAIFVVILHQYNVTGIDLYSSLIISIISHGLCTAAVPMFFFISGFLFWRDINNFDQIKNKLFRRVKTIFVPFIIWNSIYAIIFIISKQSWGEIDIHEIISSVLLYKYYFPMWFMFQLMIFFLLSPLLYFLLKGGRYYILLLIGGLILVTLFYKGSLSIQYNGIERSLIQFNFLIYFLSGMSLSRYKNNFTEIRLPNIYVCILLFAVCSCFSALCLDGYIDVFYKRLLIPFVFLSFFVMILKILLVLGTENQERISNISLLGGASPISIYFIHGLSGVLLINIFEYFGWANSLIRYVVLSIACVFLSIFFAKLLKRLMPIVYKVLCGNRV